ncbi:hypothetical protein SD70_12250 [Gordoniibacillus kamchatkensis]|uniref:DUF4097 domain-containing protein n=1 Tax=Gordoniibacillus kamchatkensis TaxID=1590651 RepID=A0ABR5AI28_9BACL|nr:DUF4097 family beta strand repeat-containing protein [Paenibacillus sp. VKM B-2647]KIL40674.1 hypothetical protein SD70_12250 [Paenibacillus sp. VKM B-2647]
MRFIKGLVFLVGLVCFIVGAVGVMWVINTQEVRGSAAPGAIDITRTVPAAGIKSLNVSTDIGAIVFKPGSGSEITARLTGQVPESRKDEWTLTADTGANGTWNVRAANSNRLHFGFEFGELVTAIVSGGFKTPLQLEISLPPQAFDTITVHTDTGRIQLGDMQAGTLDASASTGAIDLESFKGKDLRLHTNTGAISFKNVSATGQVAASTDTGRVAGSLAELASPVTMETNTGAVSLDLPADASAQLDLATDVGKIDVAGSSGLSYQSKDRRHIIAKSGTAAYSVKLKTDTGHVSVNVR